MDGSRPSVHLEPIFVQMVIVLFGLSRPTEIQPVEPPLIRVRLDLWSPNP